MKYLRVYNEFFKFYNDFEFTGVSDLTSKEKVELDKIIKILEEDCNKYMNSENRVTYRGIKDISLKDGIAKLNTIKNRVPKDTNRVVSDMIDDAFYNELGYRLRSAGNFTTRAIPVAANYGTPYMFIPIGDYKYFWSEQIEDLFNYLDEEDWYHNISDAQSSYDRFIEISNSDIDFDEYFDDIKYEADGYINDIVSNYTDEKINGSNYHEIIFMCDSFYLIDLKYARFIEEYLKQRNP